MRRKYSNNFLHTHPLKDKLFMKEYKQDKPSMMWYEQGLQWQNEYHLSQYLISEFDQE